MKRDARSLAAEEAFKARLHDLGAVLVELEWLGNHEPHRVRCAAGHKCSPRPHNVAKGQGICPICGGNSSGPAEATFRARLDSLGAVPLEPYVNATSPVRVRCAAGHDCSPRPHDVNRGRGICRICVGLDPATAKASFRARLVAMQAVFLGPYANVTTPCPVRCSNGHECNPMPARVIQGGGVCRTCSGHDPAAAEAAFRARLSELGAVLHETRWLGARQPHRALCAGGHDCRPTPMSVQRGNGICRICARVDRATAEAAFMARLSECGAQALAPYRDSRTPVHVRCASGHDCYPWPSHVTRGIGVCQACAGKDWDAFYVVRHDGGLRVKFGITNGTGEARLSTHRRSGYASVVRLVTGLPGGAAIETERAVRAALALAGERPIKGREYFDISCLAVILDIADHYLVPAEDLPAA